MSYEIADFGITDMDTREILAANLKALQAKHRQYKSTPAIERASEAIGRRIGKTTVQQIQKAATPVNIDHVHTLALLFGLDTWQLLVPDLDPANPPVLRTIGPTEDEMYRKLEAAKKALDGVLAEGAR